MEKLSYNNLIKSGTKSKIISCILWLCVLNVLYGCTAEEESLLETISSDIQFSISIDSSTFTRMQTGLSGNEAFQLADQISLQISTASTTDSIVLSHSLELTKQGWKPDLSWQGLAGKQIQFTAFYPLMPQTTTKDFTHTVAIDQRNIVHYASSDLLIASTTAKPGQKVELHFQHQMSLIEVNLTSDRTFTPEQLAQAVVQIHAFPSIQVNSQTGQLDSINSNVQNIIFHSEQNGTFRAIIPSQLILESWRKGWIDITLGNQTFTYAAPRYLQDGSEFQSLLPGQRLKLTLKLEKNAPIEDWANKTVWVYGLKDIPNPNIWGYADASYDENLKAYPLVALKWKTDYGWYDCNKQNPAMGSGGDSEMCWAASCANILYWWLEQNKMYIEKFGYQGPSRYENASNAEIFTYYKRNFPNEGRQVYEAIDWFLTGRKVTESEKAKEEEAGFFKQVLGKENKVARYYPTSDRTITELLKQAFKNREAIECNILYKGGYMHAINIWGARFDSRGEVSHIYITDNNDTDLDKQPEYDNYLDRFKTQAGLLEKAVEHRNGTTYMESSSPGDFSMQIIQVCTLGLMQEKWEAYFAD